MTRRDLLSIFASLPMFGWLKPKPKVDPVIIEEAMKIIRRRHADELYNCMMEVRCKTPVINLRGDWAFSQ